MDDQKLRLQVYLSRAGVASRRRCEQLIAQGRVRVNGVLVQRQGTTVDTQDRVELDGRVVEQSEQSYYVALHKPKGYLSSNSDPEGRPLAIDLLRVRYSQRLFPVGRLDFQSSGLLLFTNDGDFANRVSHPSYRVEKEYVVETKEVIPDELLEKLRQGVNVAGERYRIKRWERKGARRVRLVLEEGKNRELRVLFQHFRFKVRRIHRVRVGPVRLGNLPPGDFRSLTKRELAKLREDAGRVDHGRVEQKTDGLPGKQKQRRN